MPSNAAMPDDLTLLPERDVREYVERFAADHRAIFERTRLDDWAEAVTKAPDDDVMLDSTEKLLVALKKRGLISGRQAVRFMSGHARELKVTKDPDQA